MRKQENGLHLIHQDSALVVVEKPSGLLSVPGRGPDKQDCIVNRLKAAYPECIDQPAAHRLDMDTSGLMVLALTAESHRSLSRQFQQREVSKRYIALLDGIVPDDGGEINLAFRLDVDNRPYQIYDPERGKPGTTIWKKIGIENKATRVLFMPLTGRTHQLRVHAAHRKGLGVPIIGDRLYGHAKPGERLLLHASYLSFTHPLTGEKMNFTSTAPF